ncbi:hypothetical protein [Parendozoicomonas haliclonae]|nr:hypothetical protein [Parendozoicomonas haliclonae]
MASAQINLASLISDTRPLSALVPLDQLEQCTDITLSCFTPAQLEQLQQALRELPEQSHLTGKITSFSGVSQAGHEVFTFNAPSGHIINIHLELLPIFSNPPRIESYALTFGTASPPVLFFTSHHVRLVSLWERLHTETVTPESLNQMVNEINQISASGLIQQQDAFFFQAIMNRHLELFQLLSQHIQLQHFGPGYQDFELAMYQQQAMLPGCQDAVMVLNRDQNTLQPLGYQTVQTLAMPEQRSITPPKSRSPSPHGSPAGAQTRKQAKKNKKKVQKFWNEFGQGMKELEQGDPKRQQELNTAMGELSQILGKMGQHHQKRTALQTLLGDECGQLLSNIFETERLAGVVKHNFPPCRYLGGACCDYAAQRGLAESAEKYKRPEQSHQELAGLLYKALEMLFDQLATDSQTFAADRQKLYALLVQGLMKFSVYARTTPNYQLLEQHQHLVNRLLDTITPVVTDIANQSHTPTAADELWYTLPEGLLILLTSLPSRLIEPLPKEIQNKLLATSSLILQAALMQGRLSLAAAVVSTLSQPLLVTALESCRLHDQALADQICALLRILYAQTHGGIEGSEVQFQAAERLGEIDSDLRRLPKSLLDRPDISQCLKQCRKSSAAVISKKNAELNKLRRELQKEKKEAEERKKQLKDNLQSGSSGATATSSDKDNNKLEQDTDTSETTYSLETQPLALTVQTAAAPKEKVHPWQAPLKGYIKKIKAGDEEASRQLKVEALTKAESAIHKAHIYTLCGDAHLNHGEKDCSLSQIFFLARNAASSHEAIDGIYKQAVAWRKGVPVCSPLEGKRWLWQFKNFIPEITLKELVDQYPAPKLLAKLSQGIQQACENYAQAINQLQSCSKEELAGEGEALLAIMADELCTLAHKKQVILAIRENLEQCLAKRRETMKTLEIYGSGKHTAPTKGALRIAAESLARNTARMESLYPEGGNRRVSLDVLIQKIDTVRARLQDK